MHAESSKTYSDLLLTLCKTHYYQIHKTHSIGKQLVFLFIIFLHLRGISVGRGEGESGHMGIPVNLSCPFGTNWGSFRTYKIRFETYKDSFRTYEVSISMYWGSFETFRDSFETFWRSFGTFGIYLERLTFWGLLGTFSDSFESVWALFRTFEDSFGTFWASFETYWS